jgi:tryptophan synthase alpha subunit
MDGIKATFAKCKEQRRSALVAYITAGYPTVEEAVDILLGMENGGAGMSSPTHGGVRRIASTNRPTTL